MNEDEAAETLYRDLNGYSVKRLAELKATGGLVAHYTSAANAINILSGKSLWLRNAALMNDFLEIAYGKRCLIDRVVELNTLVDKAVEGFHLGVLTDVLGGLDNVDWAVNTQTYLTSFAQHAANDDLGKLSMWRAYGGPVAGVAIVFNTEAFENEQGQMNVFGHPVVYGQAEFDRVLAGMVDVLSKRQDLLAAISRDRIHTILFHMLQDMVLTTKHEGFREEEEWRVIYSPFRFSSAFVENSIEVVNGLPQVVHKIPLRDQLGLHMPELELDWLIDRVIVGPCQYPAQVAYALQETMTAAGIKAADKRIRISNIPLRQQG